ncbi:DNA-directed DNA polymerase I [Pyrofollis japonicus]|uniref:DNA-directed DNA polymerase I n=1 Tax=Pyrofollis japonicus TaxID=3060460 RepID=UPI00295B2C5E|nr:DNA-directed DNA polymerase I [Pyrofollis japonicus]BEP17565.1 DNA-directed DNA polymerase I [Pyrofollis japonicus]
MPPRRLRQRPEGVKSLLEFLGKKEDRKEKEQEFPKKNNSASLTPPSKDNDSAAGSLEELLNELKSQRTRELSVDSASVDMLSEKPSSIEEHDAKERYKENVEANLSNVSAAKEQAGEDESIDVSLYESLKEAEVDSLRSLSSLPLLRLPREAVEGDKGFLIQTYYDGDAGVAVVKLYDDQRGEVIVYHDKTGYKPYFLTDIPPDKLQEIPSVVRHPGFDHVEVVEKFDLLRWQKKKVTKIVVRTPDIVRVLRDKVPRAWEANIKFHHNYIYDYGLVPGMIYEVRGNRLVENPITVSGEELSYIKSAFENEDEDTINLAVKWYPIFEAPPPKPKRVAVDIEVYTPFKGRVPDPSTASYPVISVAFAFEDGSQAVFVLKRPNLRLGKLREALPKNIHIEIFDDERALILETFKILANYPIVISFNGDNFDFPYLYMRALRLGIDKSHIPFRITRNYVSMKYGVHIDLYQFFNIKAIQAYAFGNAYKEFTLDAIASALLGEHKVEVESSISDLSLLELVRYNARDAYLTLQLTKFNNDLVWTLIILLMRISKLPIEDVTRSQVSAWIKSLFYWEHRRRGYLIPTREEIIKLKGGVKSLAIIKGKKYQGAIVLDPASGVFFNVVVLDFASLYPSIIKRWNLSYETVNPAYCPESKLVDVPGVGHKVCMSIRGLTSQIVGLLRDYRVKIYKKKAKNKELPPDKREWYNVVQAAMKVYINASYGVFGAENFPFYAPPVAESVTAIGRYTIKQTLQKAAELGLRVLYGDTDSLFVWNPHSGKLQELQEYVEKEFGLDLEVDKIYRFVTFSGLKKNYIGVYEDGSVDVKGMVAKKRNTPEFLKREFAEIIKVISSVRTPEDFVRVRNDIKKRLKEMYKGLRDLSYNLDELAIKMALNKPVHEYTKNTPQHVKAARQLLSVGVQVLPGDIVSFVKVKSKEGVKPVQLARLPEVDIEKYIESMRSVFEQLLSAISMSWDEIIGASRLEAFIFSSKR